MRNRPRGPRSAASGGQPGTVLESESPYGSRRLVVEYDGATTSAYLHDAGAVLGAAWIANHEQAPQSADLSRLNAGQAREAAERFAVLLREFPDSARTREARYYRFRALDSARASDASLTPAYEQALDAYLAAHPKADGAAEARYLLAELHRARGECKRAQAEYAQVGSGPFAARAHLGDLECRVAMLGKGN